MCATCLPNSRISDQSHSFHAADLMPIVLPLAIPAAATCRVSQVPGQRPIDFPRIQCIGYLPAFAPCIIHLALELCDGVGQPESREAALVGWLRERRVAS